MSYMMALPERISDCSYNFNFNKDRANQAIDYVSDKVSKWYADFLNVNNSLKVEFTQDLKKGIKFLLLYREQVSIEVEEAALDMDILDIFMCKHNIKNSETNFPKNSKTVLTFNSEGRTIGVFVQMDVNKIPE